VSNEESSARKAPPAGPDTFVKKACRSVGCACGNPEPAGNGVSRRSFMKTMGVSAAASSRSAAAAKASGLLGDAEQQENAGPLIVGPKPILLNLFVNGRITQVQAEPSATLLEALRLKLNLTGSKEICDRGACGGCSVLMDGKLVNSCMMLAIDAASSQITTVEGLEKGDKLDPVQEAFIKHDAMQCGYCTPGFVVASRALLNSNPKPTLDQIKHALGGNICRCGTYTNIFNAVLEASGQAPLTDQKGA